MHARISAAPRSALLPIALAVAVLGLHAQAAGLADPVTVWDNADNPASWGFFPDAMAVGLRGTTPLGSLASLGSGSAPSGEVDLLYSLGGLSYRMRTDGSAYEHYLTSSAAFGDAVSLGLGFRWDDTSSASPLGCYVDAGVMVRPTDFLSIAAGLAERRDAAGALSFDYRLGAAVRPLWLVPGLESALTVSGDAEIVGGSFAFTAVGARLMLDEWLSVNGRYSLGDSSFGVGVSVSLSGTETGASYSAPVSAAADGAAGFGSAVRVGRATRQAARVFGKATLVVDGPGAFADVPPRFDFDTGIGNETDVWFGQAVAAIRRAASDRSIGALVMIDPPGFASDARAQEFGRAVGAFRAAGKPVYVYARGMGRLSYVYAAAGAELVALDPNGSLAVVDAASVGLYFKGLLAKLGVETYNLQSHDTKTAYNAFSESGMTGAERAMLERYVRGLAAQSYEALDAARGAKLPGGAAAAIGGGPYLDPRRAVEAGLVDALMYRDEFDDAVKEKTGDAPTVDLRGYARERGLSWGAPLAKKVAVVYLSGNIIEGEGVAGRSIGDSAAELLAGLRDDEAIAGVLLRVDSGGGSALTSDHIAREVKKLREKGKPVVVSMASYAASGGYYISAYADRIVAEAGTVTGSIGVTGLNFSLIGTLEKLGVGADGVSAGDSGLFGNPFLPHREGDDAVLRSSIEYVYGRFVDVVAEGRELDRARVDELGKGQIWLGSEAFANGLVDGIGGLDEAKAAMAELLGSSPRFVEYLPGEAETGPLLSMLGASSVALPSGAAFEALGAAASLVYEISAMGNGLLYLAPEYMYRNR
ncbi:MAG: S49 family peptidase [Spirochaetes bacterium]|nr:S49 family peptidase [Spirochaetota bacterium]MBU1080583.1 S49 family peptidase [Spirochaetota bacterium]